MWESCSCGPFIIILAHEKNKHCPKICYLFIFSDVFRLKFIFYLRYVSEQKAFIYFFKSTPNM